MPIVDVFAERKAQEALQETWGHLAPEPRRVYTGHVLFAHGAYGDVVVLECEFEGMADSPWFFNHLTDWVSEQVDRKDGRTGIWRFDGSYIRFKNGRARFRGKVRPMLCIYRIQKAARTNTRRDEARHAEERLRHILRRGFPIRSDQQ